MREFCVKFNFLLLTWWMMIFWVFHVIFSAWIHEHALVSLLEGLYRPNLTFFLSLQSQSLTTTFDVFDVFCMSFCRLKITWILKGTLTVFFYISSKHIDSSQLSSCKQLQVCRNCNTIIHFLLVEYDFQIFIIFLQVKLMNFV